MLTVHKDIAWLGVLLPTLVYFIVTRMHQLGASTSILVDQLVVNQRNESHACAALQSLFYTSSCDKGALLLSKTLDVVQSKGLNHVVASVWRHDSEAGRGHLLLSDENQIWRYEVGGGPIAIGKSLQLDKSGCRSKSYCSEDPWKHGTGGLAIDFSGQTTSSAHPQEGRLLVGEWGEGRIVRLEENGARTPLLLHINGCGSQNQEERVKATDMMVSPFGDLWLIHQHSSTRCRGLTSLFQISGAANVPPLESLQKSREAHGWNELPQKTLETVKERRIVSGKLGGMTLAKDWTKMYVSALQDGSVVLLEVPLQDDTDDDETTEKQPQMVFNLTEHAVWAEEEPGLIASTKDSLLFWSTPKGVLVVDLDSPAVLTLLPTGPITALTMGHDGFLYVATKTKLMRIRTRTKPLTMPTNLVVR